MSTTNSKSNNNESHHPQNDRYTYPTITICATAGTVGYGCDSVNYEFDCASTIESYILNLGGFENINGEGYQSNDVNENEVRAAAIILSNCMHVWSLLSANWASTGYGCQSCCISQKNVKRLIYSITTW